MWNKIIIFALTLFVLINYSSESNSNENLENAISIAKQSLYSEHLMFYIDHATKNNIDTDQILENVKLYDSEYIKNKDKNKDKPKPTTIDTNPCHNGGCIDINGVTFILKQNETLPILVKYVEKGDFIKSSYGYSEVYFTYEHYDFYDTINIMTEDNYVKVTGNHSLPIIRNSNEINIKAKDVIIGDALKQINTSGKIVTFITYSREKTKYILTRDDNIIINNVTVSCHVGNHRIGSIITWPLRWIYNFCPHCINQDTSLILSLKYLYENIFGYFL